MKIVVHINANIKYLYNRQALIMTQEGFHFDNQQTSTPLIYHVHHAIIIFITKGLTKTNCTKTVLLYSARYHLQINLQQRSKTFCMKNDCVGN